LLDICSVSAILVENKDRYEMKCCGCKKEIDFKVRMTEDNQPTYFRKVIGRDTVKVICMDCIKDPKKKEEYCK
jgi:hypothetical protein